MSETQNLLEVQPRPDNDLSAPTTRRAASLPLDHTHSWRDDAVAKVVLLLPGILLVLFLAIFPLIVTLYFTTIRIDFVKGGVQTTFVGLTNFKYVLTGTPGNGEELWGRWRDIPTYGTAAFILFVLAVLYLLYRYVGSPGRTLRGLLWRLAIIVVAVIVLSMFGSWGATSWYGALILALFEALLLNMLINYLRRPSRSVSGLILRLVAIVFASGIAFLTIVTLTSTGEPSGLPGAMVVTLIFVFVGVTFEYSLGLGLALLVSQELPGKRFFRVAFLLPMMITPVGIGFLFRMLMDTSIGPIAPLWRAAGLTNVAWSGTAFGARAAVLLGDIWQWTPFMFIILLAALQAMSQDQIEAARVDGATRWQLFRFLIIPQIMPASITLVLIRTIESFKIIDLPNILTGGGPGTATESLTLYAYNLWRGHDFGSSAVVSYVLLITVTFIATVYFSSIRRRLMERL